MNRSQYRSQFRFPFRIAAVLVGGVLLLAGCADRPTSAELTESILSAAETDPTVELTTEEAGCIAQRLLDSSLSDTTMAGLAENFNEPEVLTAEVEKVTPLVSEAAAACVTAG